MPGLLRWWDGSTWTQHTHQDGGTSAPGGTEAAATTVQPGVQPAAMRPAELQPTTVQPTTVQPAVAQPTTVQPTTVQPTTVQPTTVQPTTVQPTTVQPTTVQPSGVQPTTVQPGMRPAAIHHGAVQHGAVQHGAAIGAAGTLGPSGPGGANGTQVLFLGELGADAWRAPGGAGQGDPYGYRRAQRRRRMWVASGLAVGTVVALGVIALVVNALGQTSAPSAAHSPAAPTAPVAAATSQAPSSPTASPSASATTGGSTLTDGQSGLSYTQLAAPWQPNCPGTLNNQQFTWTAGESAVAGQVNGGQTTWYGAACSGPLPQQYGYSGVADLDNVATQLANQFNGTYYGALSHNFQQQVSQPFQVSGHAAWEVKFLITYTNPQGQGLSWTDELGAVVVADSGTGTAPAVFYVSVPGNLNENNVDTLVSSLQLATTPQPTDSATTSPPATGSPAPGNGNGNGP